MGCLWLLVGIALCSSGHPILGFFAIVVAFFGDFELHFTNCQCKKCRK